MKTSSPRRCLVAILLSLAIISVPAFADQNLAGNVTITGGVSTGNLNVTGAIDSDSNLLTFGTQSTSFGAAFQYQDNSIDTLTFSINRTPGSWLWKHNTAIPAMRLDSAHQLILYQANGTTAGVTLTPVSNQLSLGTATLTASGMALSTNGPLTVGGNITNTTGSITGGTTGLTLNAGGTNQNINLLPSGTGKVGVGTSSPVANLDVISQATGDVEIARFINPNIGVGNSGYINVGGSDAQFSGAFLGFQKTGTGTGLASLGVRGSGASISINQLGNVGIGTTSPGAKLEVNAPSAEAVRIRGDNSYLALFNNAGTRQGYLQGSSNNLVLAAEFGVLAFNTFGSERVRIDSVGNVGVGTTTPQANLDLWKSYTAGTDSLRFSFNDGSAYWMGIQPYVVAAANVGYRFRTNNVNTTVDALAITGAGNVGIGTTNPGAKLHIATVSGAFDETLRLDNLGNAADNGSKITWYNAAQSHPGAFVGAVRVGAGLGIAQVFGTSANWTTTDATERMRVDPSGNVGIGTSAPKGKFSVALNNDDELNIYSLGDNQLAIQTSLDGQAISTYGGPNNQLFLQPVVGNVLMVTGGGNVGIGTTNPTQKLSVAGSIRAYEVIVDTGWSDYVFDEDYKLKALSEVEAYVKTEKHLPGIPSAKEVAEHGVNMGEMESKLLAKVEELTLHMIAQEKEISALRQQVAELKSAPNH